MEKHSFPEKWEVEHYQDVTNVYLCVKTGFQTSVSWAYLEKAYFWHLLGWGDQ